jgi:hypothetical protein
LAVYINPQGILIFLEAYAHTQPRKVHFWHLRKFFALKVIQDFGSGNVMDAVGIERGEARGATAELQYPSATVPVGTVHERETEARWLGL